MLVELADASVYEGVASAKNAEYKPVVIEVSLSKINSYMGVNLTSNEVNDIY